MDYFAWYSPSSILQYTESKLKSNVKKILSFKNRGKKRDAKVRKSHLIKKNQNLIFLEHYLKIFPYISWRVITWWNGEEGKFIFVERSSFFLK